MARRRQYSPLDIDEPEDEASYIDYVCIFTSEQVTSTRATDEETVEIIKSVCLALFLLFLGISFFVLSFLHASGHFVNSNGAGWGFFVLGIVTFLPGFYHSRIAYYAWRGYTGYSLQSIPTF